MNSPESNLQAELMVPEIKYEVVATYPHDSTAFTEGLAFHHGRLFESTGFYPARSISTLREVEIRTGKLLRCRALQAPYFAEGLAILDGRIFQLTYLDGKAFVYDLETFSLLHTFSYAHQGWGLTVDKYTLIMSNGSNCLQRINPYSFENDSKSIEVSLEGKPLYGLNELEIIDGSIYANVFTTEDVYRIDLHNGQVTGWMDLKCLRPAETKDSKYSVLNGIAYDEDAKHLFVTGKNWSVLFEIRLT